MARLMFGLLVLSFAAIQAQPPEPRVVLVVHGGVGVLTAEEMKAAKLTNADFEAVLAESLRTGFRKLNTRGAGSADAVEAAIRVLEDSELFNAGKGAVFTSDGQVELDAAIMDGSMQGRGEGKQDPRKRVGAVTGLRHVKNPISAARAVMEMDNSRHCFLAGEGAEAFVLNDKNRSKFGIERVDNMYFWTDRRLRQVQKQRTRADMPHKAAQRGGADLRFGTVGAVAVDSNGRIVAGTSTGGLSNKWPGRIGDTPVIGAGTYADDRACGISCTGTGELFIRHAVAHDITARMVYAKKTVADAVQETLANLPEEKEGVGGIIALDGQGRPAFGISPNCDGMYRGYVTADGDIYTAVGLKDPLKRSGQARP